MFGSRSKFESRHCSERTRSMDFTNFRFSKATTAELEECQRRSIASTWRPSEPQPAEVHGSASPSGLSPEELRYLESVMAFTDLGTVARNKKLGISNRKGDALRAQLLDLGLVETRRNKTKGRIGRTTITLQLTPGGRNILGTMRDQISNLRSNSLLIPPFRSRPEPKDEIPQ